LIPDESFTTISEFQYFLDKSLIHNKESPMVMFPVFLNASPEELPRLAQGRKINAAIESITPDIFRFEISLRKRSAKGYLVNYEEYWVVYLSPDAENPNLIDVASRWLHHMFPLITPAFISYLQLIDIVSSLKVVEDSKITVLDYVARSAKERERSKHWPERQEFSRETVHARIKRDNAIMDAIRIRFSSPNFNFRVKLSRRGMITFYDGVYSEFHRLALPQITRKARENLEYMRNRERKLSRGRVFVDPLSLKPESELTKEDLMNVKDALGRRYVTAVLYGGNPWLLVSLLDKSDGSSLDLHAYHDEIIITPVIKVSAASLTRLYSTLEEALPTNLLQLA
jgi:hypothetical protein